MFEFILSLILTYQLPDVPIYLWHCSNKNLNCYFGYSSVHTTIYYRVKTIDMYILLNIKIITIWYLMYLFFMVSMVLNFNLIYPWHVIQAVNITFLKNNFSVLCGVRFELLSLSQFLNNFIFHQNIMKIIIIKPNLTWQITVNTSLYHIQ